MMPHSYLIRVQIEDTDYAGVVYHSIYLNYLERARSEWIDKLGMGIDWQREHDVHFAVYSAQLDFLKPARLHQWLTVVSQIKEVRQASLIFNQDLHIKDAPDIILFKAEVKIACIDRQFRPKALPKKLLILMENTCEF